MSEQRPLQQPMVPAASERRARPEIRVFRRRRLLTPEQPPTGGAHRPAQARQHRGRRSPLAARRSGVWTRAPPLLVSGAGRGQYGAPDPSVWRGSLPPTVRVRFLGRGSLAGEAGRGERGGGEATDGEWVEVCLGEGCI